jgi:predicted AAA+ superfamily ATPase
MMIERDMAGVLRRWAGQYPLVTLTGPRQSGKTTLVRAVFPELDYVSLENPAERNFAKEDPKGFLKQHREGAIFDEVQRVPELFSWLQGEVDDDPRPGRFVLTGSQQFEMLSKVGQSLAGRSAIGRLLPLSTGELDRAGLLADDYEELLYRGFYPAIHSRGLLPYEALSFYTTTYLERDVRNVLKISDLGRFELFLRLCAGRVGQVLNMQRIGMETGVSGETIRSWLSVLEASHVVFLLKPWHANLGKRLVKRPKLYFVDVGLAAYLIGIRSRDQVDTHPLRGNLFENLVVAEAAKQLHNAGMPLDLNYYRDHKGHEVDLLHEQGGRIAGYEMKATRTLTPALFKGLGYFGSQVRRLDKNVVVHGGNRETREWSGGQGVGWAEFRLETAAPLLGKNGVPERTGSV